MSTTSLLTMRPLHGLDFHFQLSDLNPHGGDRIAGFVVPTAFLVPFLISTETFDLGPQDRDIFSHPDQLASGIPDHSGPGGKANRDDPHEDAGKGVELDGLGRQAFQAQTAKTTMNPTPRA